VDHLDTHTASFKAQGAGYLGSFTLDPITTDSKSGATGEENGRARGRERVMNSVGNGESQKQMKDVRVEEGKGGTDATTATIMITLAGTDDAPVMTSAAQGAYLTEDKQAFEVGNEADSGKVPFTDVDHLDTHMASFKAQGAGYLGSFTLDPITTDSKSGATGE